MRLEASEPVLRSLSQRSAETAAAINEHHKRLVAQIEAISGSGLRGDLNDALQQVTAELNARFQRATETLRQLGEKIGKAATDMAALDAQGGHALRSAATGDGPASATPPPSGTPITNVLTGAQ